MTVMFKFDSPNLTTLRRTPPDQFKHAFNPTNPVFIETDGACSGNPGSGGWGFIIAQEDRTIEAYGAEAVTTNNTMELKAIDEGLTFLPSLRAYVVIESDSQGCLDMMMGEGAEWKADDYLRLNGERVKNAHRKAGLQTLLGGRHWKVQVSDRLSARSRHEALSDD
jgi:ribonuclease HI